MLPPFGARRREKVAALLMFLCGLVALLVLVAMPETFVGHGLIEASRTALVVQSALVLLGAVGAFAGIFSAVALGTVSGLIPTGVGYLTFLPSLGLLVLALERRQLFLEFRPRRTGAGPPPPGPWR